MRKSSANEPKQVQQRMPLHKATAWHKGWALVVFFGTPRRLCGQVVKGATEWHDRSAHCHYIASRHWNGRGNWHQGEPTGPTRRAGRIVPTRTPSRTPLLDPAAPRCRTPPTGTTRRLTAFGIAWSGPVLQRSPESCNDVRYRDSAGRRSNDDKRRAVLAGVNIPPGV